MSVSKSNRHFKKGNIAKTKKYKNRRHRKEKFLEREANINNFFGINLIQMAIDTGYLVRTSPITPFIFIYAMSLAICGSMQSLNLFAANINEIFGIAITGNAFCSRMNKKQPVTNLKAV